VRAALCVALALLAGCAGTESASRWVDETLYGAAKGPPQVAYVAADRVKVYRAPDPSSPVQGVLDLREELTRYQSDAGFAYVEAAGNLSGWVREDQLAAKRPAASRPAKAKAEPAQPAETTPETPAEPPVVEPEPAPEPEPVEPESSVFDPY
jgi:hypothetical protein